MQKPSIVFKEYGRRMRQPYILKDRYVLLSVALLASLFFAEAFYILIVVRELPHLIILHENIYFGIDRIGPWFYIFFFPALQLLVFLVHGIIGSALFTGNRTLSYLTLGGGVLVSSIIGIGGVIVVHSNI